MSFGFAGILNVSAHVKETAFILNGDQRLWRVLMFQYRGEGGQGLS